MSKKYRVAVIDMNLLFFRCFTTVTEMNEQGIEIGGYSQTITSLLHLVKRLEPDMVICAWDGKKGSKKRRDKYGEYKEGRKVPNKIHKEGLDFETDDGKRKELTHWQMHQVYKALEYLPFMQLSLDGYEGDDIISFVSTEQFRTFDDVETIIVSNDKDFLQLIGNNTKVYRRTQMKVNGVMRGEDELYDMNIMKERYNGLSRNSYLLLRMFEGDSSDNISGIKGIGIKTYLKHFGYLSEIDEFDPREFIQWIPLKLQQMNTQFLKEHKEEKPLKSILDKIVKYREDGTDMNGLEVLERNYNIMQLESCIIDSVNKTDLDNNISNYIPVYSPFEFFLKLNQDGISSIKMNEDRLSELCNQIKLKTNKFLEEKFA